MYELLASNDDDSLFYRLDSDSAERYGVFGYIRMDFGKSGREFWSTWFDSQPIFEIKPFRTELDDVINSLRDDGIAPPFASRENLVKFCAKNPGRKFSDFGDGYLIRTLNYSYYFRCQPRPGDYDAYCFVYDNRRLLPELVKHENK